MSTSDIEYPLRVYVHCNPLLDISAHVDDAFLDKFNIKKGTAILFSPEQEGVYAALEGKKDVTYVPGGSGLNSARVCQWLLSHHFYLNHDQKDLASFSPKDYSRVSYVGCIADDEHGKILRTQAEKNGVFMAVEYANSTPEEKISTGVCAVCIYDKERTMVAQLGACERLSPAFMTNNNTTATSSNDSPKTVIHGRDYDYNVVNILQNTDLFYMTGFTLTLNMDYVRQVAKASKARRTQVGSKNPLSGKFIFNLSAPFIIDFFHDNLMEILPHVDILFSNDDEARILAKKLNWEISSDEKNDVLAIARRVVKEIPYENQAENKARLVVFTRGSNSVVYAGPDGDGEVPVTEIKKENVVDTNGAGDAFVGGFLAAYALNRSITRCCEVGNYAAGVVIQHDGCTYPETPKITP